MSESVDSDECNILTLPVLARTSAGSLEPRVRFTIQSHIGQVQVFLTMVQVDEIIKNFMSAQHQSRELLIEHTETPDE